MNKFEAILLISPEVSKSILNDNLKNFEESISNNSGKIKIKNVEDNTAENVEILIHLIKGVSPNVTIDALYSFTNCEISISPNCCVIYNDKPVFLDVNELLRISTDNTVNLLKKELRFRLTRLNEKWHSTKLEQIFIENKIYRDIEDCLTWDSIIDTISKKLIPFKDKLLKDITNDDIINLTEIKIKRISKYDSNKQIEIVKVIESEINEVENDIDHIVEYSIRYFEHLLNKYGSDKERKTVIQEFDSISATSVVIANKKLYANFKEGFIGTKLKSADFISKCSNIDDIIVFMKNGQYLVTKIDDKKYIGKNIIHLHVWKKNDNHMIYNVVYKDGKSRNSYVKRFSVTSVVRDKLYDITQSSENSKVLYFTANPNSESEIINIFLDSRVTARNKSFNYNFNDLAIKNRTSKGNIISKYSIRKIIRKSVGESTLGGRKIWIDENIGRLNIENRGIYLGSFNADDKIIVFFKDGSYELTSYDMANRYRMNDIVLIEKLRSDKIYTLVYKDGKNKNHYIKRFKIETSLIGNRISLITENWGSKYILISNEPVLNLNYNYRLKNGDKKSKKISVNEFIEIKGYKAIGKIIDSKLRMSGFKFESNDENHENDKVDAKRSQNNEELTLF